MSRFVLQLTAVLALFATSASAQCSVADIKLLSFSPRVEDRCKRSPCPELKLVGELQNNCASAIGVKLKVTGRDKNGIVVDTVEGWPASISNIPAQSKYAYDLSIMRYRPELDTFEVSVLEVKRWKQR